MNLENFKRVLDHIEAHPETWDQETWHCGTTHCFAGHAQIMSGKPADPKRTYIDAVEFLDLKPKEAELLFFNSSPLKDFTDFYSFRKENPNKPFLAWPVKWEFA